ncbi:hypothetical protein [uncultured Veillonella sp.]|uniref:hypothetical protein n=1 Tax=uncultured Veillonella sp. TaxID=159268 RepID=UPI00262B5721|nr:hypothetical protein [uncultured Veillonella sp.]
MNAHKLTGTALLLGLALLSQSLRLFVPIPMSMSMYVIGTLVGLCLLVATWRYGLRSSLIIAWVTPVVAFMQGMLPLFPFIFVVGIGNSVFAALALLLKQRHIIIQILLCGFMKSAVLYGGFQLLFLSIAVPAPMKAAILASMAIPQIITATFAIMIARLVFPRLNGIGR